MLTLGIESSSTAASVALVVDDEVCAEVSIRRGPTHASHLHAGLRWMLERCAVGLTDISGIGVCNGPGSFTGLRIGVCLANALSYGLSVPLFAIGSLEALARTALGLGRPYILAVQDARRGELFGALFRVDTGERGKASPTVDAWREVVQTPRLVAEAHLECVLAPFVATPEMTIAAVEAAVSARPRHGSLALALRADAPGVSAVCAHFDGAPRQSSALGSSTAAIAAAAAACALRGGADGKSPVVPIYVRPPDVRTVGETVAPAVAPVEGISIVSTEGSSAATLVVRGGPETRRGQQRDLILGIETSADDTAVAVVERGTKILASFLASQLVDHARYGGIVPEIASRRHLEAIVPVLDAAMNEAGCGAGNLAAVAATDRPGLIGSLLVGVTTANALSYVWGVPFIPVDHIAAHAYASVLTESPPPFPHLCLAVSGGHTLLLWMETPTRYSLLGRTRDDAAGELFDKVAKMLGLGYPGGPAVERAAARGRADRVILPRPMMASGDLDFSFSGLKTAAKYAYRDWRVARGLGEAPMRGAWAVPVVDRSGLPTSAGALAVFEGGDDERELVADLCAGLQEAVAEVLVVKTLQAARVAGASAVSLVGGVAANQVLRHRLREACASSGLSLHVPPPPLCTDNGAMVAGVGWHLLAAGVRATEDHDPTSTFRVPTPAENTAHDTHDHPRGRS